MTYYYSTVSRLNTQNIGMSAPSNNYIIPFLVLDIIAATEIHHPSKFQSYHGSRDTT